MSIRIDKPPHVVFAGGGTAGHLFPGLAVAEQLASDSPHTRITFVGPGKQLERQLVAAAGFDYLKLPCRPLPAPSAGRARAPLVSGLRGVFRFLLDNAAGQRAAGRFLQWQRVAVVVGLGGYASVPMARAAVRCGVPLVLLEQNAFPGRATRWLARSATLVCTAFEQTARHLPCKCPLRVTGNPIRRDFARRPAVVRDGLHSRPFGGTSKMPHRWEGDGRAASLWAPANVVVPDKQLLIFGGSGGARTLNQNVPRALYLVASSLAGWKIVHQSGVPELESTRELYRRLGLEATVTPFVADMPHVLAQSDLAVCRSGGTTLAELAAAALPAILLPYPYAADGHQRKNADVFTKAGGCLTLDEREVAGRLDKHLAGMLWRLLNDPARRAAMSAAVHRLAQPDAAWDVATMIRQLTVGSGQ